jgi:toxin ParE1/3/4
MALCAVSAKYASSSKSIHLPVARNEVRPSLRSMAASPHIVFYRVNDGSAEIIRVLDGRRDLDEIFAQDP